MSNPETKKEYREKQRINNRKNFVGRLLSTVKYKCNKDNIPFNLTKEDIVIPEYCPKTGLKLTIHFETGKFLDTPSLDRIDPSKGYVKGNVQIVCFWYNVAKLNWPEEEFINMCRKVVAIHGPVFTP